MDPMDGNETHSDNSRIVDCDWLESESCRIVVLGSSILAKIAIAIILLSEPQYTLVTDIMLDSMIIETSSSSLSLARVSLHTLYN